MNRYWGEIDTEGRLLLKRVGSMTAGVFGIPTQGTSGIPQLAWVDANGTLRLISPNKTVRLPRPARRCAVCQGDPDPDVEGYNYNGQWACSDRHHETLRKRHQREKDGRPHRWQQR